MPRLLLKQLKCPVFVPKQLKNCQVSRPTEEEKKHLAEDSQKLLSEKPLQTDIEYTTTQMVKSPHFWIFFIVFGLSR